MMGRQSWTIWDRGSAMLSGALMATSFVYNIIFGQHHLWTTSFVNKLFFVDNIILYITKANSLDFPSHLSSYHYPNINLTLSLHYPNIITNIIHNIIPNILTRFIPTNTNIFPNIVPNIMPIWRKWWCKPFIVSITICFELS